MKKKTSKAETPKDSPAPKKTDEETPRVTTSPVWRIRILALVSIVVLVTAQILWNKRVKEYDLATVLPGESLELTLMPSDRIKVNSTSLGCDISSDGTLTTVDEHFTQRILEGNDFISGPMPEESNYYKFENQTQKTVTIKITRK